MGKNLEIPTMLNLKERASNKRTNFFRGFSSHLEKHLGFLSISKPIFLSDSDKFAHFSRKFPILKTKPQSAGLVEGTACDRKNVKSKF